MHQKTSLPLQKLIFGMSAAEKALLKKNEKLSSGRKTTLPVQLFNVLATGKSYSSDDLCMRLGIKSKTQLSGIKAKLFDEILQVKLKKTSETSVRFLLTAYREQILLLMKQGLYDTAEALSKRAVQTAKRYGQFSAQIEFLHLQNNATRYKNYRNFKKTNSLIFQEIDKASTQQQLLEKIRLIYEQIKVTGYHTWRPITESEMKDVRKINQQFKALKKEQNRNEAVDEDALIKIYFLLTESICNYFLHEENTSNDFCKNLLNCWENNSFLISEFADLFLDSVKITGYIYFLNNNIKAAKSNLRQYVALGEKYLNDSVYKKLFFTEQFNITLKIYHKTAQYDLVKTLIESHAEKALADADEVLPPPGDLSICTSIGISHFVMKKWDDAEMMILKAKERNYIFGREDVLYFTLIFHLLILYEKKEWYRLHAAIDAAYQHLYSRKKLRSFEKLMLSFIKQLLTARDNDAEKKVCKYFLQKLNAINEKERSLCSLYFNFPGWAESKVLGINYTDYVSGKLNCKNN